MSEPRNNRNSVKAGSLRDALAALLAREAKELPWLRASRGWEEALLIMDEHRIVARRWAADAAWSAPIEDDAVELVRVVSGLVEEERYLPEGDELRYEVVVLKPGGISHLPRGGYRRLEAITRAVTLHAGAPGGETGIGNLRTAPTRTWRRNGRTDAA